MKRLYPDQPIVGIGIVIVENQKIVLIRRGNEPAKGKWSIPGGLIELGESPEASVIREAKEETLLEVDNPRLLDVVNQAEWDTDGKIRYHYVPDLLFQGCLQFLFRIYSLVNRVVLALLQFSDHQQGIIL